METILRKLVSFPTISEKSNEELMLFINDYLKKFGIRGNLIKGNTASLTE